MNIYNLISLLYFIFLAYFLFKIFKDENKRVNAGKNNSNAFENIDEIKIRKHWLIFLILNLFGCMLADFEMNSISNKNQIFELMISSLKALPAFLITYYCSFKMRGTAWLKTILFTSLLANLMS